MSPARRHPERPIDWIAVRDRLARAGEGATEPSAEHTRAILEERARLLAVRATVADAPADTLEVLTFTLGTEHYAVETKYIREVVRVVDFTPVPGVPSFIIGVTNHRGQVLCVVDLRPLLGASAKDFTDRSRLILLGTDAVEFGVLADHADSIRQLPPGDIREPGAARATAREYLRGVSRDALSVLDGALLLRHSRLYVDQSRTESAQTSERRPC